MLFMEWPLFFISCFYIASGCNICVNEQLLTSAIKCPTGEPCGCPINPHGYSSFPWPCDGSARYRTFEGSCNNLENPTWGMANTPYMRLLLSNYGDNNYTIAGGLNGTEKPLARVLSTTFFPDNGSDDKQASLVTMHWGQIVTHDILLTNAQDSIDSCCNLKEYKELSTSCLPIKIPSNDSFYSQFNVTCFEKSHNARTFLNYCGKAGAAEQVNGNSHFMDGSQIYGPTLKRANSLREFRKGALKHQLIHHGKEYLPDEQPKNQSFHIESCTPTESNKCLAAGDIRSNQNPQLTVLHTLLLREHNRISNELHRLNPTWDDEKLYQESRAIVGAILQHISYNEWLPQYVGESNMVKHKLKPTPGQYTEYLNNIRPIIISSFATSVFRMAHSGIQGNISKMNENGEVVGYENITEWINKPSVLFRNNHFDRYLLGLVHQPMQAFGDHFASQITQKLFNGIGPYGQDLASLDIIRGRSHGLAPYIHYLQMCTGQKINDFDDLEPYINKSKIAELRRIYKNVADVDLFVGAALEEMVPSARLGPTNLCITLEQFYRLKWGDRFWYENRGQPHSLSHAQLMEIKKMTLARIICDNGDNITKITLNVFMRVSDSNPIIKCDTIAKINLREWS